MFAFSAFCSLGGTKGADSTFTMFYDINDECGGGTDSLAAEPIGATYFRAGMPLSSTKLISSVRSLIGLKVIFGISVGATGCWTGY